MTNNAMPPFRGSLPKPFELAQKYQFDQDAQFVAAYLLKSDKAGKRTITRTDGLLVCQIELLMRRAKLQHVIDVTMSLVDAAGQPKETPEKVAEIRLNPEAARVCRAELHVDRSAFMVYNRFLDWLWLEELIAGWRVREIRQDEAKRREEWRGTGERPTTRADKVAAIEAWDSIDESKRPQLVNWLELQFGITITGDLNVPESTFHGWRKLKKS